MDGESMNTTSLKKEALGIYAVWLREFKRFYRDKGALVGSLARPLLWFLILGAGLGNSMNLSGNVSYPNFIAPGIVGMTVLFTSLFSGISIIWDREFGFLKEMLVAPISRISIIIGKALGGSTNSLIQSVIVICLAMAMGVQFSLTSIMIMLPLIVLISIGFVSMGVAIASFMDTMEGFNVIMNFIVMPMFLLSGALFPISGLSGWFGTLLYVNPMTYSVDALRYVSLGVSFISPGLSISAIAVFSVSTSLIAAFAFSRRK